MAQRGYLAIGFFCFFSFLSHSARGRGLQGNEGVTVGNKTSTSHLTSLTTGREKWFPVGGEDAVSESTEIQHWATLTTISSGIGTYYGVQATLNVYGLPSITKGKVSSTQIWVGDHHQGDVIQAGWHVRPDMYGDNDIHFYVHWTADRWQSTGCYNLQCEGFVRDNSSDLIPGRVIRPLSKYNGDQYEITLKILKRSESNNWELTSGPNADKLVGYWPGHLFKRLAFAASRIDIGGTSLFHDGDLSPPMGSGHFAAQGQKNAAYIRDIKLDENGSLSAPGPNAFSLRQDKPDCYTIAGDAAGTVYYGGPGNCKN